MTIGEALRSTTDALREYSDAPHLDAERIVLHALKKREPSFLLAHAHDELSDTQIQEIMPMIEQRKAGKPLAYILGEADFYGRTFIVTPDVLIPRPDTEMLIEKTLEYVKKNFADKEELVIADICTGSGCIAITLALELGCRIIATDISPNALAVAKQNAQKHGVADSIEFIEGDMLSPIKNRHIDLIVSNPPYVPSEELNRHPGLDPGSTSSANWRMDSGSGAGMTTNVNTRGLLFEPRIALDGGIDGQKFIDQIKASNIPAIIEITGGEIIQT